MGEAGGGLVVITELPHSPPVYDWGDGDLAEAEFDNPGSVYTYIQVI